MKAKDFFRQFEIFMKSKTESGREFDGNRGKAKIALKDMPSAMGRILETKIGEESFLMPDGKRIPPNAATFYMNSADFSGIKFILPETKKQLFAKMEARFKDARQFNWQGGFEVNILPNNSVARGEIECELGSRKTVASAVVDAPIKDKLKKDADVAAEFSMGGDVEPEITENETLTQDLAACETQIFMETAAEKRVEYGEVKLVVLKSGRASSLAEGDIISLEKKPEVVVGRDADCDRILQYPFVSGQQFRLVNDDEKLFIQNLSQTNTTKVNSQPLIGSSLKALGKRDKIQIADLELCVSEM